MGISKMSNSNHLIMSLLNNMTKLQQNKLTPQGKLHIPFFQMMCTHKKKGMMQLIKNHD
jgi:hypothetical protein